MYKRILRNILWLGCPSYVVWVLAVLVFQFAVNCSYHTQQFYVNLYTSSLDLAKTIFLSTGYTSFGFYSFLLLMVVVSVYTSIYSVLIMRKCLEEESGWPMVLIFLVTYVLTLSVVVALPYFFSVCAVKLYYDYPRMFLEHAINTNMKNTNGRQLYLADLSMFLGAIISNLSWCLIILSTTVIVTSTENKKKKNPVDHMEFCQTSLHSIMYLAAVVLATSTLSIGAWLSWPVHLLNDGQIRDGLLNAAKSQSFYYGSVLTCVMAIVFIPALTSVRRRARIYEASSDAQNPAKEFLVILGPMIAGAINVALQVFI